MPYSAAGYPLATSSRRSQPCCVFLCAGKSSLLAALLGEMYNEGGTVSVAGSTGFAAQDPWIQNATLCDNILMGSPLDEDR